MIDYKYILIPILAGLIGWGTNYLAIQLLFYPTKEKKILFLKIQGLIPKKRNELIKKLSHNIEKNLFNHKDIQEILNDKKTKNQLIKSIKKYIYKIIEEKLPSLFQNQVKLIADSYFEKNKDKLANQIIEELSSNLENISIAKKIEKKLEEFSLENLNKLIIKTMKEELKHIEILGGIIGILLGIIQLIFL